ncbi:Alpha/Beta hydrolase protein [Dichotomocladium elegans]|nr:Alpha/Beta hydrolase protein [Dichotomocladium elegans]
MFHLPMKARVAAIAAVLRCPVAMQKEILGAAMAPQGEQLQSILHVEKKTWRGSWISRDIQKMDRFRPLRWAESTACHADLILLYFHGGGFRFGTSSQYMDSFMAIFKLFEENHQMKDVRILSIDYSLSPDATHPVALDECICAYRYLVHDLAVKASHIIIAGDSAGGNLSAAILHMLKHQEVYGRLSALAPIPLPAGVVMLSPWVVLSSKDPVLREELILDYVKKEDIDDCVGRYLPQTLGMEPSALSDVIRQPDVSPFYGDFSPPVCPLLVAYSSSETLANQIEAFVRKLQKSGVDVAVIVRENAAHLWIMEPLFCATNAIWTDDLTKLTDWCAKIVQPPA